MPHAEHAKTLSETWRIIYRHSAGRLGSHARAALRDEGRILGLRTADGDVLYPPRDLGGDGEWVELGPSAVLLSPVPAASDPGAISLVRVRLDGASRGMFARLAVPAEGLTQGARLTAVVDAAGDIAFLVEEPSS